MIQYVKRPYTSTWQVVNDQLAFVAVAITVIGTETHLPL